MANKQVTTLLLNWFSNPYHAPIFVGQHLGYYSDVGIELAIMQPNNPSDVTKIVAQGKVDIGLKAMIHTIAGRARGHDITSVGTLLDEPVTGLIYLKESGIKKFSDIRGKRIGYIGEFGKKIVDNLAEHAGIGSDEYETVRVGMYMVDAIMQNKVDAAIGFSNFHQIELEEKAGPASILRIDELADLGCCCFCSIHFITHSKILNERPELLEKFLFATQRAASFVTQNPEAAYDVLTESSLPLNSALNKKIFIHTLPLFSRNLLNVERDWNKVYKYTQHIKLHSGDLDLDKCYTNKFIEKVKTYSDAEPVASCI